ncbi:MAG: CHASE2 domain-containing protein [Deltaproteobacteria bacterium]|nr:CHASE2 domain-containing protein [Deltaproteobacteria bacterium]
MSIGPRLEAAAAAARAGDRHALRAARAALRAALEAAPHFDPLLAAACLPHVDDDALRARLAAAAAGARPTSARCAALCTDGAGEGHLIELLVDLVPGDGEVWTPDAVARDSALAVQVAAAAALGGAARQLGVRWQLLGAPPGATLSGGSLGLAAGLAALAAQRGVQLPTEVAVTGGLDLSGVVQPVAGVPAKLRAAAAAGRTRALVPAGEPLRPVPGLELLPVRSLAEAAARVLPEGALLALPGLGGRLTERAETIAHGGDPLTERAEAISHGGDQLAERAEAPAQGGERLGERAEAPAQGGERLGERAEALRQGGDRLGERAEALRQGGHLAATSGGGALAQGQGWLGERAETLRQGGHLAATSGGGALAEGQGRLDERRPAPAEGQGRLDERRPTRATGAGHLRARAQAALPWAGAGLGLLLGLANVLAPIDLLIGDQLQLLAHGARAPTATVVLAVGPEQDLVALRPRWAAEVEALAAAGARAVVFDLVFSAPQPGDAALAAALRAAPAPVVLAARARGGRAQGPGDPALAALPLGVVAVEHDLLLRRVRQAPAALWTEGGAPVPHLAAAGLAAAEGAGPPVVEGDALKLGLRTVPLRRGRLRLAPFAPPPRLVLGGDYSAAQGKIVVVGAVDHPGDQHATAAGPRQGVELLAALIETLAAQAAPARLPLRAELPLLVAPLALQLGLGRRLGPGRMAAGLLVGLVGLAALLASVGWELPVAAAVVGVLLAAGGQRRG